MNLSELVLARNEFTGFVPVELLDLNLSIIELHSNDFTGTLSLEFCDYLNESLTTFTADCLSIDDIVSEVDCSCCTSCCSDEFDICSPNNISSSVPNDEI